jgi:hypothetical protein
MLVGIFTHRGDLVGPRAVLYVVKVKFVPVLLIKQHAMKAYFGVEVKLHPFFDLCTRWR